jgi:hypothetical protein
MSTTTEQTKTANPATLNPGPPKPPALPPILTLQHFLDLELTAQKSSLEPSSMVYEGFTLKSKDFAISIILIDTTGDHYAGIKDTDMYYSGSLVKVAGLYAAHDLRAEARRHAATQSFGDLPTFLASLDGVVNPTGAILRLRAMSVGLKPSLKDIFVGFKPSAPNKVEFHPTYQGHLDNILHNAGARGFIRPLGYSYINVSMMRSGFFDPDPAKLNGIWLAGDYSGDLPKAQRLAVERVPVVNDTVPGGSAQAITTKQMSRLFRLVHATQGFSHVTNAAEKDAANQGAHAVLRTQSSFFSDSSTFSVPILFGRDCAKVGIGNLGPVDTPGPKVFSEGAVMTWTDTAQKDAFNSNKSRSFTGEFVLVWQNLYHSGTAWDALAKLVNNSITKFLTQA